MVPAAPAEAVHLSWSSTLEALRYRDFRALWSALVVAEMGLWMQNLGFGWLVVLMAVGDGSPHLAPLYLGAIGLARAFPALMLGLFGGAFADRFDRRLLMLITSTATGALSLILGVLAANELVTLWSALVVAAATSGTNSFFAPARQSLVPRLVPPGAVMSAIGLNTLASNASQIVAPAIGGILIVMIGIPSLFFVNAVAQFGVTLALLVVPPQSPTRPTERRSILMSLADGLVYIRDDRVLLWTMMLAATACFFARPYIFLLPAVAQGQLHAGPTELSWLMSATGAGAIGGSVLIASIGGMQHRGRLLLLSTASLGLAVAVFAMQSSLPGALAGALGVGFATMLFAGVAHTILQTASHVTLQGRVISVYVVMLLGVMPLGQLALGAAGSVLGIGTALLLGGAITVAAAGYAFARAGDLRELTSTRSPSSGRSS